VAGLQWDAVFERGSDDAVFAATDGVPRLVNQLCDLALVQAGEARRKRVGPADITSAWRDIQRLPAAALGHVVDRMPPVTDLLPTIDRAPGDKEPEDCGAIVEFGSFDDESADGHALSELLGVDAISPGIPSDDGAEGYGDEHAEGDIGGEDGGEPTWGSAPSGGEPATMPAGGNPWSGPEVELVFDGIEDPFAEYFADAERVVERYVVRGPADFSDRRHVASREGTSLSRQLPTADLPPVAADPRPRSAPIAPAAPVVVDGADDADMVVIEEDLWMPPVEADRRVIPVRLGDYRRLFARMRRGGSAE